MQKVSRITLGSAVVSGALAAIALAVGGGGGPDAPMDTGRCLAIYFYLIQVIFLILVICFYRCDEDRNCQVSCVRTFFYLFILLNFLLIICLLRGRFG